MSYGQQIFPSDRVLVPVYRYAENQPPFLPQVPIPHQDFGPMMHAIASMVANQAGEKSMSNPGRTYHYNVLSQNGFNNQDFAAIVSMVVDYIFLAVAEKRLFRSFGEALPGAVDYILRINCAAIVVNIPALMQVLPNDIQYDTQQSAQQMQGTITEIMQMRQRMQSQVPYGGHAVYADPRMAGGYPAAAPVGGGFPNAQPHHAPHGAGSYAPSRGHPALGAAAVSHSNANVVGSALFGGVGAAANEDARKANAVSGKHSYLTQQRNARAQAQQANQQPLQDPRYQPTQAPAAKWKPTSLQPYVTLATALEEYYLDNVADNGKVFTALLIRPTPLKPGENPMDRKAHVIGSAANTAFSKVVPVGHASRNAAFTTSLKEIGDAAKVLGAQPEDNPEMIATITRYYGQQDVARAPNLDSAIFTTRYLHKKELGQQTAATAFRYDIPIGHFFVSLGNFYERLSQLRSSRDFVSVANRLKVILDNVAEDRELKDLVVKLDSYLTNELNEVLKTKLSFPDLRISSFIDDAKDLFGAINDVHGYASAQALTNFQGQFIDTFLYFAEPEIFQVTQVHDGLTTDLPALMDQATDPAVVTDVEPKSVEPVVHIIETLVSVTSIEMVSQELNMVMPPDGIPAMIDAGHPDLYAFAVATITAAEQIANSADRIQAGASYYFAHHYLVTADDVVFELHRGLLNDDSYLISRR